MKLSDLLIYENIFIQCHDNPDADAISSGYGLYEYFKSKEKNVKLIYGGRFKVTKPNLIKMIEELNIPIKYVDQLTVGDHGVLITVDCQYGAGNVTKFDAKNIAIIDHHQQEIYDVAMSEIRSYLGSCATLVWQMLLDEEFDVNQYKNVATALYYGLFTDTNSFIEIHHPLDKDLRDNIEYDINLIRKLKNANFTLQDIEIAGIALIRYSYIDDYRCAIFKAHPCDPNILGFISDLALQVDAIDTCVVYNETNVGVKFSVRSCIREVMASEMAAFLAEGIGSGGGHMDKAGGFIHEAKFDRQYPGMNKDGYLHNRIKAYFDSFDIIYHNDNNLDIERMSLYKKKNLVLGFVPAVEVFKEGTPLLIRTIEGDIDIVSSQNVYIMIGIKGEVYPISKEKFNKSYKIVEEPFNLKNVEYFPTVKNRETGQSVDLRAYAKACISTGEVYIYAQPLLKNTKVFTKWDPTKYMSGKTNDYIAVRQDDIEDVYIIENSIFNATYQKIS
ncbi:DHH family phosphoesterase [Defluviitalea saccharophila]|uniref:DHH family phosphoesterase n=1 Tax=Defluviitalea saccharophila TaxID=879970 RepID=A0ABZ2Y3K1_9FIRM